MQHAGVHVTEHAITQAMAVQKRAKLNNIVGQVFRWNGGIFNKGDRFGTAFGITE